MEGKNWSSFDLDFQVTIYLCAISFPKQTLHFNFSPLQERLLIAQAQAITLTYSTIVVNDDVAASTVVGADTGTVIQDSKPNEDVQAQESEIDYEFNINGDPVNCNCVIMNDVIPASEAKIEAEIAAIETQRHRATIKYWLVEAQLDCNCDFFSPTAVTSLYVKVGNHQGDSIIAMTGTFTIDRAVYLWDIDTRKEEAQLYVPKISIYKSKSYLKLQEFTRAYEHMYKTQPVTYRSVKDQIILAKRNLQDSPYNAW